MKNNETDTPVVVCRWKGADDRFYGKFKDPDETEAKRRWKKIPGGAFGRDVDTREKALACARRWYEVEMAERKLTPRSSTPRARSWPEVCDGFVEEVKARHRGADSSKHDAEKRATFLRRDPLLSARPIAEHDDELAVTWVRGLLSKPLGHKGHEAKPRDPLTVRNAAKILDAIYKFAQSKNYYPRERRRPTEYEEFKAEIAGALKEKAKLGKVGRVACPIETVKALVNSSVISQARRLMTSTSVYTGIRPGELHALRVGDFKREHGVLRLDIREQQTLSRKGYPSKLSSLKTAWAKRKIPTHPILGAQLEAWLARGWSNLVGREPTESDFLFPTAEGKAFREVNCADFLADVERVGCDTTVGEHTLDLYSLRHTFATMARRAGIASDTRDRLLGHRPRDTKALHYEDEDLLLPLLAEEISKLPTLVEPDGATNVSGTSTSGERSTSMAVPETTALVPILVSGKVHASGASSVSLTISAEEKRFELLDGLHRRRFSNAQTTSGKYEHRLALRADFRPENRRATHLPERLPEVKVVGWLRKEAREEPRRFSPGQKLVTRLGRLERANVSFGDGHPAVSEPCTHLLERRAVGMHRAAPSTTKIVHREVGEFERQSDALDRGPRGLVVEPDF